MRGDWKRTRDGHEYQEWRFSTEELREDVLRYRMTPEEARRFLLFIRWLIDKLLTTKSDARRVAAVNMLQKFLTHGYRSISNLAAAFARCRLEYCPECSSACVIIRVVTMISRRLVMVR